MNNGCVSTERSAIPLTSRACPTAITHQLVGCRPPPLRREAAVHHPGHRPLQLLLLAPDGRRRPAGGRRSARRPDTGRAPRGGRHLRVKALRDFAPSLRRTPTDSRAGSPKSEQSTCPIYLPSPGPEPGHRRRNRRAHASVQQRPRRRREHQDQTDRTPDARTSSFHRASAPHLPRIAALSHHRKRDRAALLPDPKSPERHR